MGKDGAWSLGGCGLVLNNGVSLHPYSRLKVCYLNKHLAVSVELLVFEQRTWMGVFYSL